MTDKDQNTNETEHQEGVFADNDNWVDPDFSIVLERVDYDEHEGDQADSLDEQAESAPTEKGNKKLIKWGLIGVGAVVLGGVGLSAAMMMGADNKKSARVDTALAQSALQVLPDPEDFDQYQLPDPSLELEEGLAIAQPLETYEVVDSREELVYLGPQEAINPPVLHDPFAQSTDSQNSLSEVITVYGDQEIKHHDSSQFMNEIGELQDQSNFLAESLIQLQDTVESNKARSDDLVKTTENHEERIRILEEKVKEEVKPKAKPKAKPKPVAAKPVAAKPAPKQVAKTTAKPQSKVAKPAAQANNSAADKKPAFDINKFKMVGIYPSERIGVTPQVAWITDGERLIEVTVGSIFDTARVTRLENNTVFTNKGAIR